MTEFPLVSELSSPPRVDDALAAFADWRDVVLFDSALLRTPMGRYSFLSADPALSEEVAHPRFRSDPFAIPRRWLQQFHTAAITGLPPFQGGVAGFLSYELGGCWERLPVPQWNEFHIPAALIGLYDWVLAWDHLQNRAWVISQGYPETDELARATRAAQRLHDVQSKLTRSATIRPTNALKSVRPAAQCELAPQFTFERALGITSNFSRDNYLRAVERVIEYIHAGDIFQANLSQRLLAPWSGTALDLYRSLRACNPAPFAGMLARNDWAIVSASPERFVRVAGRDVETRPIKGTRRRREVPEADLFTRDELRESEKDVAENVMIVDLLRNDLSRVCEPGSISVPQLCAVETYETVQHLVSQVCGRLAASGTGADVWSLLAAVFPGGSITGAPKVRAMEIIAELEPTVRGPYCGTMFYVGFDGTMDSNILIRTFVLRDGWVQCSAGGGIVAQSDPQSEYDETLHKAEGMLRVFRGQQRAIL